LAGTGDSDRQKAVPHRLLVAVDARQEGGHSVSGAIMLLHLVFHMLGNLKIFFTMADLNRPGRTRYGLLPDHPPTTQLIVLAVLRMRAGGMELARFPGHLT
jgi:hypothetical protein